MDFTQEALDYLPKRTTRTLPPTVGYQYLLSHADTISQRCNKDSEIITNNAMIDEPCKVMPKSVDVARMTRLAFLFVLLSFTTSFFSMNFVQIVGGPKSTWNWVTTSLPVSFVSFLLVEYDLRVLL